MSANALPSLGASGDGHNRPPSGSPGTIPQDAPHVYSSIQHTDYEKILTQDTMCSGCDNSNSPCMQKCKTCGWTTCVACHSIREYDYRHILSVLPLDWGYKPQTGKKRKKVRFSLSDTFDTAQPSSKVAKTMAIGNSLPRKAKVGDDNMLENEQRTSGTSQAGLTFDSVVGGYSFGPPDGRSSVQSQGKKTRVALPTPKPKLDSPNTLPITGPSSLGFKERSLKPLRTKRQVPSGEARIDGATGLGKQVAHESGFRDVPSMDQYRKQQARYEVGNPYGRTAKHTAHTDQQLGAPNDGVQQTQESLRPYNSFVPINKKSASDIKSKEDETDVAPNRSRRNLVTEEGTITDAGPATPVTINNNNMHLITNEWDHKAFPDAKKDWIIEKLVAGGHRSIEIIAPQPTYKAHSLTIYLSHFKEFMEHFDPWAMENRKDFERQWLLLNKFVRSYHDDLPHLSGTSVDDEDIALTKLEREIETEALEKGMSSKSFWVFWVYGMRQSLEKLTSNWSPRSKSA